MIQPSSFDDQVQAAFRPTSRGVVGLVDNLLQLCEAHQLRVHFHQDHCSVRRLGAAPAESLDIPLAKPVFRAALARVAAICNEQRPDSTTPYGGSGEIAVPLGESDGPGGRSTCFVRFTNTPIDQNLELRFSQSTVSDGSQFTVLLRDQRAVLVNGHTLRFIENSSNPADSGSYGIVSRVNGEDVLVALFRVGEVIGVFNGELRGSRLSENDG